MSRKSTFSFLINSILNSDKYTEDEKQHIRFYELFMVNVEIENAGYETIVEAVHNCLESYGFKIKKEDDKGSSTVLLAIRGKKFFSLLSFHGEHGKRLGATISILKKNNPLKIQISVEPFMELIDLPEEDGSGLSQDFHEKYSDDVASIIAVNAIAIRILNSLDQKIPDELKNFSEDKIKYCSKLRMLVYPFLDIKKSSSIYLPHRSFPKWNKQALLTTEMWHKNNYMNASLAWVTWAIAASLVLLFFDGVNVIGKIAIIALFIGNRILNARAVNLLFFAKHGKLPHGCESNLFNKSLKKDAP